MRRRVHWFRLLSLLLLVTNLGALPAWARARGVSLGARIGVANSSVIFEDEQASGRVDSRRGLHLGGTVSYELRPPLALQLELSVVQRGWQEQGTGGGRRLTYLEMPLLLVLDGPWRTFPQVLVGPSLSFELACSVTDVPDSGDVSCGDPRVAWDRKRLLLGLWFGLGVSRRIGSGKIGLQLVGSFGLTDMNREDLPRGSMRLFAVTASVVYAHSLGGR